MTWKEFKDTVEARGIHDESEIEYIDISGIDAAGLRFGFPDSDDGMAFFVFD